jgi:ABC-type multidrug transport system ATPase subunit
MGLRPPVGGRVRADGVDLHDCQQSSLRARIGLVPHDPVIFRGTLRENIALARPDATLDEVMAAVRTVGLDDLVARLPRRYETLLGPGGTHLSRGEQQRLAIARVLLRAPDVVLLDEVMTPPEGAAEQMIRHNLRARLAGKTVVLTARSLDAVRDADLIYLLHRGKVVGEGTHEELSAREGGPALPAPAPTGQGPEITNRHERRILELYMEGHSEGTIALEMGTYDRSVRRVLERMRELVKLQGFEGLFGSLSLSATRELEPPPPPQCPHPSGFDLLTETN